MWVAPRRQTQTAVHGKSQLLLRLLYICTAWKYGLQPSVVGGIGRAELLLFPGFDSRIHCAYHRIQNHIHL